MAAFIRIFCVAVFVLLQPGCGGGAVPARYRPAQDVSRFDTADWANTLKVVATPDGYVRHDLLKSNDRGSRDALYRFVGLIGAVSPTNRPELFPTVDDRYAYWINAYNALCMYAVDRRGYPGNMLAAGGVPGTIFFIDTFSVGGQTMSLNTLETKYARSFNDPRVHFALNCMSRSCPALLGVPYDGSTLQAQLQSQTQRAFRDERVARIGTDGEVALSEIMTSFWKSDFTDYAARNGKPATPLAAAKLLAGEDSPIRSAQRSTSMSYDWSLNRPR